MITLSRRRLFEAAALVTAGATLPAHARATPSSGDDGSYGAYLREEQAGAPLPSTPSSKGAVTEANILGPFYREGALFRAKVTPPLEPGVVVLVSGVVYGFDTRAPIANAVIDVWQANAAGRYDNDDPAKPPSPGVFLNRARVVTDESGRYELETIHPGRYQIGRDVWRPSHIHYLVRAPRYAKLVTQLYFEGDPENARDAFIKRSLIMSVEKVRVAAGTYERMTFDIVLARS